MGLDSPNYIVYIPKDFNILTDDNYEKFKRCFLAYYEKDDSMLIKHLNETVKTFEKFKDNTPKLRLTDFDGKEYEFYAIVDFCYENFNPITIGLTYSYVREMYNISASDPMMETITKDIFQTLYGRMKSDGN